MNQVVLRANSKYRLVRCQRALLLNRNRLYIHRSQACDQERRAKSLAIDLSVDLPRRFINAKLFKQSRKLLVTHVAFDHFYFYQLFCSLLPSFIRLCTLYQWSFHLPSLHVPLHAKPVIWQLAAAIISRIRLITNRQHYTSSEHLFLEIVCRKDIRANFLATKRQWKELSDENRTQLWHS